MGNEILMVVDAVSREKGVEREVIFAALEAALAGTHGNPGVASVGGNLKT